MKFQYDYLAVAVNELKRAIKWRDISIRCETDVGRERARGVMRHYALRSRKAFNGELLYAN
jgi:hypothetical protein